MVKALQILDDVYVAIAYNSKLHVQTNDMGLRAKF